MVADARRISNGPGFGAEWPLSGSHFTRVDGHLLTVGSRGLFEHFAGFSFRGWELRCVRPSILWRPGGLSSAVTKTVAEPRFGTSMYALLSLPVCTGWTAVVKN
jgi:hypothetical protein